MMQGVSCLGRILILIYLTLSNPFDLESIPGVSYLGGKEVVEKAMIK